MRDRIARAGSPAPTLVAAAALFALGSGCAHTPDTLLSAGGIVDEQGLATQLHCPGGASLRYGQMMGVRSTIWCEGEDGRKQGPFVEWYENHWKKSAGRYLDGRRHGVWSFFRPDGQPDSRIDYDHGNVVSESAASPPPAAPPATMPAAAAAPVTNPPAARAGATAPTP